MRQIIIEPTENPKVILQKNMINKLTKPYLHTTKVNIRRKNLNFWATFSKTLEETTS